MTSWSLRIFCLAILVDQGEAGRVKHAKKHLAAEGPESLPSGDAVWNAKEFTSTDHGCKCLTPCASKFTYHCSARPFCEVDAECEGSIPHSRLNVLEWFHSRNFDYCVFKPDTTYEQKDATTKLSALLLAMTKTDGPRKENSERRLQSGEFPSLAGVLFGMYGESVSLSFDSVSDVFPIKRKKMIHSVGVVGAIQWQSVGSHAYTGVFREGASGLIRLSSAKAPTKDGHNPGAGVKLFRKGRPSANFVAMPSLEGQPCSGLDGNFFNRAFTNHIPYPKDNFGLETIARKFWQASFCPLMVGLSDMASPEEGKTGTFPFELSLERPSSEPGVHVDCGDYTSKLTNFADLKAETTLFDVYAFSQPGAQKEKIAKLILKSTLVPSKFGDEQLFFKHQRMEEDFKLKPEWLETIQKGNPAMQCGMKGVTAIPPNVHGGCGNLKKDAVAPLDPGCEGMRFDSEEETQGCHSRSLSPPDVNM